MGKHYIRATCNVCCDWHENPPVYRCFVNNELFVERTYIWSGDYYLIENIQLQVNPGKYEVRFELVNSPDATIKVEDMRVVEGPAYVKGGYLIKVTGDEVA